MYIFKQPGEGGKKRKDSRPVADKKRKGGRRSITAKGRKGGGGFAPFVKKKGRKFFLKENSRGRDDPRFSLFGGGGRRKL